MKNRLELFDAWAADYDADITSEEGFPFAGYERVLERVVQRTVSQPVPPQAALSQSPVRVLDLGTGTGALASRLAALHAEVWGLDFSSQMLLKARENVPDATFLQADLLSDWPPLSRFDRVVSSYVLHEFDLEAKVSILARCAQHLKADGKIVIADIAFPNIDILEAARERWRDVWDEGEHYWAADEALAACEGAGFTGSFEQVSLCGGVFTFVPSGERV